MRASKVVAGVVAVGLVGAVFVGITHGLNGVTPPDDPFCRNPHLSYPDQNSCTAELKAATGDARDDIQARYQVKINASLARENPETAAAASAATIKIQKPHA